MNSYKVKIFPNEPSNGRPLKAKKVFFSLLFPVLDHLVLKNSSYNSNTLKLLTNKYNITEASKLVLC